MSLLTKIMSDTLDEGYADAAARRAADPGSRRAGRTGWLVVLGLLAVGLVLTTAGLQTRARATAADAARVQLTQEIGERNGDLDRLQQQVEGLRADIDTARKDALSLGNGGFLLQRIDRLEVVTGAAPAQGPGIAITVDDAPGLDGPSGVNGAPRADQQVPDDADGRVLDYDLQRLVNSLWAAGAEAIDINGRRLTSLTAIRAAGRAILVDYRPLSPPYVVRAIGDPDELAERFAESPGGHYFDTLKESYGVTLSVAKKDHLRLPAASGVTLRAARPAPTPTGGAR
jgi:uncharacterized protein YlxW (UPF0749 family)